MNSAVYTGAVRHRRFSERKHAFKYKLFMVLLDLDELESVFTGIPAWTTGGRGLAQFRREDHFGDTDKTLKESAQEMVKNACGVSPDKVFVLCNLRYFGYVINPVCFYFCYGKECEIIAILAEVTNTPWGERRVYVMRPSVANEISPRFQSSFEKTLHVSPFMDMDHHYHCAIKGPGKKLVTHLENRRGNEKLFDATLVLERKEITPLRMCAILLTYPFMTLKIALAIYFEAARLWIKGVKYRPHSVGQPLMKGIENHEH